MKVVPGIAILDTLRYNLRMPKTAPFPLYTEVNKAHCVWVDNLI